MNRSTADENFTHSLEAAMTQLVATPWDIGIIKELRRIGLQRIASGGTLNRTIRKHNTRNVNELLDWYRQMAWQPTQIDPMAGIANLLQNLIPALSGSNRDAAQEVQLWAIKMTRRMAVCV